MPDKKGRFTPQERIFSNALAASGDKEYAAKVAGYRNPSVAACKLTSRPAVQAEVARIQTERLFREGLPVAVDALIAIARDGRNDGARVQASKALLDYTIGRDGAGGERDLSSMSAGDIARELAEGRMRLAALEHVAAERARPVIEGEAEPVAAPGADLFG